MKHVFILLALLTSFALRAENDILILDEERQEITILNETETRFEDNIDRDLLKNDFSAVSALGDILVVDGQVVASVMAIGGRVNAGIVALNRALELGVDAELIFIAAGTSGAVNPNLGTYVKVRLTPAKAKTVYFKGRLVKAFNLNEDFDDIMPEFGIGYESRGSFFEASIRVYRDHVEGDTFYMPFVSFGMRIKPTKKEATLFN